MGRLSLPAAKLSGSKPVTRLSRRPGFRGNPNDRYTATAIIQKIFSDGILTLGASLSRLDYELQSSNAMDLTSKTFTEDAAFWLGPVFYAYSDGSFTMNADTYPTPD